MYTQKHPSAAATSAICGIRCFDLCALCIHPNTIDHSIFIHKNKSAHRRTSSDVTIFKPSFLYVSFHLSTAAALSAIHLQRANDAQINAMPLTNNARRCTNRQKIKQKQKLLGELQTNRSDGHTPYTLNTEQIPFSWRAGESARVGVDVCVLRQHCSQTNINRVNRFGCCGIFRKTEKCQIEKPIFPISTFDQTMRARMPCMDDNDNDGTDWHDKAAFVANEFNAISVE